MQPYQHRFKILFKESSPTPNLPACRTPTKCVPQLSSRCSALSSSPYFPTRPLSQVRTKPSIHRVKKLTHPLHPHLRHPRPAYLQDLHLRSLRRGQLRQRQSQVLRRLLRVYCLWGAWGSLVPVNKNLRWELVQESVGKRRREKAKAGEIGAGFFIGFAVCCKSYVYVYNLMAYVVYRVRVRKHI